MIALLLVFVFGTIVGSFLNVCIYRIPKEESIAFPGSHCGACGKMIRWYDNVPVASYILLRGRCRECGAKFSIQYPMVEMMSGALFVLFYHYFGITAYGIVLLTFTLALLTQSVIDFHHKIIPDVITLPGIVIGLVASCFILQMHGSSVWWQGLRASVVGMIAGGGSLFLVGVIAEFFLKKEAMGGGDVKLLAMIGAFLGLAAVAWTIFFGAVIGSLAGVYFMLVKKEEQIPFGPFLGIAAAAYIFLGEKAIHGYLLFLQSGSLH